MSTYYQRLGIEPAPLVDIVTFNGNTHFDPSSSVETETDTELSGMIAPSASIHVFTSSHNDDAGEVQLFTAILDDGRAKVANYSWGTCEADVSAQHRQDMDNIFARAIAQGVNILVASGDTGSEGCLDDGSGNTATVADFPASSPLVLAVGATALNPSPSGDFLETAWSCHPDDPYHSCSGGGFSEFYPAPAWQGMLRGKGRGSPDVSFNGDPSTGEPVFVHDEGSGQSGFVVIGGTSISAPQWAGFMALVGQARGSRLIGALGPVIYGIPNSAQFRLFHDVTQGSNGAFSAGPGWDPVTGLGSPRAAELLRYLLSI